MEIKVVCNCGQKYKFDVEPSNGRMPFAVKCPACGADGTTQANAQIASYTAQPPPFIPPPPVSPAPLPAAAALTTPPPIAVPGMSRGVLTRPQNIGQGNLTLGLLGAFLGALIGSVSMYAFFVTAHFRFPLMGAAIGALSGWGAKLFYKGTDSTLGALTAGLALAATAGTLYVIYKDFAGLFILTMIVSASMAYRISGRSRVAYRA